MKTIIESIEKKDWLERLVPLREDWSIDAVVSAKVVRNQTVEGGPGVSLVTAVNYEIVEFSVEHLKLVSPEGDLYPIDQLTAQNAKADSREYRQWNLMLNHLEVEVLRLAEQEADFRWLAESYEVT